MIEKVDLNDPTFKALGHTAARITPLLTLAHTRTDKDMIAVMDDLLGAVYALIDAHKLGFKGKGSESDYAAIDRRSTQVSIGEVKRDGNWMAGFHFNSGMFRISAVYARLVIRFGGKPREQDARAEADRKFLAKTNGAWVHKEADDIRVEVNTLKHEVGGVFGGRAADMSTALPALDQLLTLAEALY